MTPIPLIMHWSITTTQPGQEKQNEEDYKVEAVPEDLHVTNPDSVQELGMSLVVRKTMRVPFRGNTVTRRREVVVDAHFSCSDEEYWRALDYLEQRVIGKLHKLTTQELEK